MTFLDVITPGEKIDIHPIQQYGRGNNGSVSSTMYQSSVLDLLSGQEIEIMMPMAGTKIILQEVGCWLDLTFYTKHGLYRCQVQVTNRCKKGNLYTVTVRQRTNLLKFQRREYFRIECTAEVRFYPISQEVAAFDTTEELLNEIHGAEYQLNASYGKIVDISGGGMRFISAHELEKESCILTEFHLQNDRVDQMFHLVSQIVVSEVNSMEKNKFVNRAKFQYKNLKDREKIVQYVFEEERRMRRLGGR